MAIFMMCLLTKQRELNTGPFLPYIRVWLPNYLMPTPADICYVCGHIHLLESSPMSRKLISFESYLLKEK